jgi:hypothetical protein
MRYLLQEDSPWYLYTHVLAPLSIDSCRNRKYSVRTSSYVVDGIPLRDSHLFVRRLRKLRDSYGTSCPYSTPAHVHWRQSIHMESHGFPVPRVRDCCGIEAVMSCVLALTGLGTDSPTRRRTSSDEWTESYIPHALLL